MSLNGTCRLTVNGQEVEVPTGTSLLQAASAVGVEIPHLCYTEGEQPVGACRLCIVEVEGARTLPASCHTPAADGMVVRTDSPTVRETRRNLLQLALGQRAEFLAGERDYTTKLQELAREYGVDPDEGTVARRPHFQEIDEDPLIVRRPGLCIRCERCVTYCARNQRANALTPFGRGSEVRVQSAPRAEYADKACQHCGGCLTVCPTGAILEKWKVEHGLGEVRGPTICPYCGTGCSMYVHVKDGKIIGVTPDPEGSVNRGHLCVKGRMAFDFVNHPDRLTAPLIRTDDPAQESGKYPGFREATWDEALAYVADRLKSIKAESGPDSVASFSSARSTNEENFLIQKFMRAVIGTNNVDNCARVCHAPSATGLAASLGGSAASNSLEEIEQTDCLIVVGANVTEAHPVLGMKVKRAVLKYGVKLIVIDPPKIWLTQIADLHVQLKPGTNIALLNGLAHVILRDGLQDQPFIDGRTENFEFFRDVVSHYTPEKVEEITGVPAATLEAAARLYATADKAMMLYGLGVTEHISGTHSVMACANLVLLTGNLGKPGCGINPLRGQNNVQGSCDMGALPNVYPGYQKVDDEAARAKFSAAWGVDLCPRPGLKSTEMWGKAKTGDLRAIYVIAENPMVTDPHTGHVEGGLRALDLLVVQEIFLTETAKLAHVVFPAASFAEKDGTFTNADRRVQLVRRCIDPLPGTKTDAEIVCLLAERMGSPMANQEPADVMDEIASLPPSMGGISYKRLANGPLRWPCLDESDPGTENLYVTDFPRGKATFQDLLYSPSAEMPDDEYPLMLTTGRRLEHYNSGSMTRRTPGLLTLYPEERVEMNPEDASRLELTDGDTITVISRRGEMQSRVCVTEKSPPGVLFTSFHFPQVPTNRVLGAFLDPISAIPEYKVSAVRVERT